MNEELLQILNYQLYGNTLLRWGIATVSVVVALLCVRAVQLFLVQRLEDLSFFKSHVLSRAFVDILRGARLWVLLAVAVWIGSHFLFLPPAAAKLLRTIAIVAAFIQIGLWATAVVIRWIEFVVQNRTGIDTASASAYGALGFVGRIVIWAVIGLLLLENIGIDVTALVAGLGVGSIAIALAVQNILGDIFSSISIIMDKPFEVGDFIIIGEQHKGTVENIGVKSTRIRSLHGEQITISNSDLLKCRIQNYKRMSERRVTFSVGVTYQTPPDKIELITNELRRIVSETTNARLDRAHFARFGDSALIFDVVYFISSGEFGVYMDTQQIINLEILRLFAQEGIDFAYPTQTLYVEHMPIEHMPVEQVEKHANS